MLSAMLSSLGPDTVQILLLAGIGVGVLLAVLGIGRAISDPTPAAARIAGTSGVTAAGYRSDLIKLAQSDPSGVLAAFSPTSDSERLQVSQALARAGFRGANAPAVFYATRLVLGLGLPGAFVGLLALAGSDFNWFPIGLRDLLNGLSGFAILQVLAILAAIGFFGPAIWLRGLIEERKRKIEDAFPNTLDLIQIAVEAGLAFDAAMTRVATEIHGVAPDIAEELLVAQSEIQAGRGRDKALMAMGRRTGVEEVSAFAQVVLQSMQFGTSISDALTVYSDEMRLKRELKAQEKANKLPVQMSGAMAIMMLPAILSLTLGPVVIRYINYFAGG
ncbi:type II secretion system F family protein [Sulfitobacter sp. D35]|uniref:type II secretion system F family protein n=1 Tax=Sulfitobacter sp. D35 TaxID=3083252 RepID=UPI00296F1775|nr:type II secretion system F family protein [Sulfitobacter sp. D35]MDW4499977.1 type II secretion system F family protein [Sulfitobacter sp. D35]